MVKEKDIEKSIVKYLRTLWAVVETQNWWSVMIKKGKYNHRMTLQTKWCPDIMCFYKKHFVWIEVKKDLKEVEKWTKQLDKYKLGISIAKSYERELKQIEYRQKILDNGWTFILTCDINEIKDYFSNL